MGANASHLLLVVVIQEHDPVAPGEPSIQQLLRHLLVGVARNEGTGVDQCVEARVVCCRDSLQQELHSPFVLQQNKSNVTSRGSHKVIQLINFREVRF